MSLLFVYSERGQFTEAEFNDWYDEEHIPGLLSLPDFSTAQRYIQCDSHKPTYLTFYNLTTPDAKAALVSPAFQAHAAAFSDREKKMLSSLPILNQRIYQPIFQQPPTITSRAAKYIFVVEVDLLNPSPSFESEFNSWYNNIHIPDIMNTKGWVSSRRFVLQDNVERGTSTSFPAHATKYLAVHEFTEKDYMQDPILIEAIANEETAKFIAKVKLEFRHFVLHRDFS
ncbi:hypothetical protein CVT24_007147 [Panaeolus cyanescens]|uniref:EthD domain-containing protein n=1 Tax=Panaeolus cyanescens TaxID=181874 RepID=A0A409YPF7_9AGAR|nr:hypothetical protein CVT24_007147 [Panaeolus cyanescens]